MQNSHHLLTVCLEVTYHFCSEPFGQNQSHGFHLATHYMLCPLSNWIVFCCGVLRVYIYIFQILALCQIDGLKIFSPIHPLNSVFFRANILNFDEVHFTSCSFYGSCLSMSNISLACLCIGQTFQGYIKYKQWESVSLPYYQSWRKAFILLLLNIKLAVDDLQILFIKLRRFFLPIFLRVFILEPSQILSNSFSASIDLSTCNTVMQFEC